MQNPIVAVVVIVFVFGPLVTLLHELGHASIAIFLTKKPIHVYVGRRPSAHRFKFGRVVVNIGLSLNPIVMTSGLTTWPREGIGHWGHIFALMGGPWASWHQLLLFNWLAYHWEGTFEGWLMNLATFVAFSSLVLTTFPMQYPAWMGANAGLKNDARHIVDHLRAIRRKQLGL